MNAAQAETEAGTVFVRFCRFLGSGCGGAGRRDPTVGPVLTPVPTVPVTPVVSVVRAERADFNDR
ncbi:hypothetical protein AB0M39_10665 [Streptomyces sp. NPDC051907]|uniref:hypothetical protein n=1 Tax=Streptomyces sp. NPDC051907 TaxID=3155284 RepID=UPI00341ED7AB